jgi:hypothetical protein
VLFRGKNGVDDISTVALLCLKQYLSDQKRGGVQWAIPQLKKLVRRL